MAPSFAVTMPCRENPPTTHDDICVRDWLQSCPDSIAFLDLRPKIVALLFDLMDCGFQSEDGFSSGSCIAKLLVLIMVKLVAIANVCQPM